MSGALELAAVPAATVGQFFAGVFDSWHESDELLTAPPPTGSYRPADRGRSWASPSFAAGWRRSFPTRNRTDRIFAVFTLDQVNDIHDRLGNADRLRRWLHELHAIGVKRCDSFIVDGHTVYSGDSGHTVVTPPTHETLTIAATSSRDGLIQHLRRHGENKTSYVEMSKGLADRGVEKWTFDTTNLTIAYYDRAGHELLVEAVDG